MQERKCRCGTKFQPHRGNHTYCSPACANAVSTERRRVKPHDVTCDVCGAKFQTTNPATKRCGSDCARKYRTNYHRNREHVLEPFDQGIEYRVLPIKRLPDGTSIFIIGDIHLPFHDAPTLQAIEHFWNDLSPDLEIYNGDIFDLFSISKFSKDPKRGFSLQDELDVAVGWLRKRVKRNPDARRIFSEGNHEDRLRSWFWKYGADMRSLRALTIEEQFDLKDMGFEHVTYRSIVRVLGCEVQHGWRASRGNTANPMNVPKLMAQSAQSSGVCGHSHGLNTWRWRDTRGSHSYREGGCACSMRTVYAPFPTNWAWGFVYGQVHRGQLHLTTVPVYDSGFHAEGKFYSRVA